MINQQHPITPPPELVQQWDEECESGNNSEVSNTFDALQWFASKAAQWGADQELEACCETLDMVNGSNYWSQVLRSGRRSKLPSLKEQALALLNKAEDPSWDINDFSIVRQALEQLND
jgi:hypothetical protein